MKLFNHSINRNALPLFLFILAFFLISSCKKELDVAKSTPTNINKAPVNTVYVGSSDSNLYAIDAISGTLKWKFSSTGGFSYSSPTVKNGIVYAGNTNNIMYALDATTGAVKWQYATSGSIESAPVVSDGLVYFGSDDFNLYVLDATTGSLKWSFATGHNLSSSPTVFDGIVYFGSSDNYLYALDAKTSSLKWKYNTAGLINASSPVIVNGIVYIGSRNGYLDAVEITSGQLKWQYSANGISLEMTTPVASNGLIYFSGWYNVVDFNKAGSVYAVNETSGTLVWKSLDNIGFSTGPAIANGNLYISADDNNFYSLNATTGSIIWKNSILPNGALPTVKNDMVFIGGGGTRSIYGLYAATGQVRWKFGIRQGGLLSSKPYVTDENGD
ncbi:MAG TPA: PQQ-binding-like beta-propeller repeat protein [Mucilaginibacter sp.]|jgi:outer membrane protein assembly factor BamB